MSYIVVKGVPSGDTFELVIGNIFGIFKTEYNAEFLKEYYEKNGGTNIYILKVYDDDSIKGLMLNENLKQQRNTQNG